MQPVTQSLKDFHAIVDKKTTNCAVIQLGFQHLFAGQQNKHLININSLDENERTVMEALDTLLNQLKRGGWANNTGDAPIVEGLLVWVPSENANVPFVHRDVAMVEVEANKNREEPAVFAQLTLFSGHCELVLRSASLPYLRKLENYLLSLGLSKTDKAYSSTANPLSERIQPTGNKFISKQ